MSIASPCNPTVLVLRTSARTSWLALFAWIPTWCAGRANSRRYLNAIYRLGPPPRDGATDGHVDGDVRSSFIDQSSIIDPLPLFGYREFLADLAS